MELRAQWLTLSGEQAATVARLAQAVLHFELSRSVFWVIFLSTCTLKVVMPVVGPYSPDECCGCIFVRQQRIVPGLPFYKAIACKSFAEAYRVLDVAMGDVDGLVLHREGRTWVGPFGGASSCEGHAPLLQQMQLLCNACTAAGAEVASPLHAPRT